jgi:hypothetical protein
MPRKLVKITTVSTYEFGEITYLDTSLHRAVDEYLTTHIDHKPFEHYTIKVSTSEGWIDADR